MVSTSSTVAIKIKIEGGEDLGVAYRRFEWKTMINGGYIIRVKLADPNNSKLLQIINNEASGVDGYLQKGRKQPLKVEFSITDGVEETEPRIAIMTELRSRGIGQYAELEFIAIDPPTFFLNAGNAEGIVYEGKVSDVIKRVVEEYTGGAVKLQVTETIDNEKNVWPMMRQDPKTFIMSMLDWSSSICPDKSRWIVSSNDDVLNIREESELASSGLDLGLYTVAPNDLSARDIDNYSLTMNNFISAFQSKLITGGISAISGQYFDPVADEGNAIPTSTIDDEATPNKVKVQTGFDRAFSKPDTVDWATYVMSVPEHNGGDVGVNYGEYVNGRARQVFSSMLPMVMKITMRIDGDSRLNNSELLGVSTIFLDWKDIQDNFYFLHGCWILYGFHHIVTVRRGWQTQLYLYRPDYDASGKNLKCSGGATV